MASDPIDVVRSAARRTTALAMQGVGRAAAVTWHSAELARRQAADRRARRLADARGRALELVETAEAALALVARRVDPVVDRWADGLPAPARSAVGVCRSQSRGLQHRAASMVRDALRSQTGPAAGPVSGPSPEPSTDPSTGPSDPSNGPTTRVSPEQAGTGAGANEPTDAARAGAPVGVKAASTRTPKRVTKTGTAPARRTAPKPVDASAIAPGDKPGKRTRSATHGSATKG